MATTDISWIDGFVKSIAEHVYVREIDSLLILLPNQAYKLNPTGVALLKQTLTGTPIKDVLEAKSRGLSTNESVLADVHSFFCDVRALLRGCLGDGCGRLGVERVPFQRPHNTLPVLSEVALTYHCNLSCKFCYAGCQCSKKDVSAQMTTDQVKTVLDIIRNDAEVPSVSWTGGEPTLRGDIVDLTAYATRIGMRVNLITNGTLLNTELVSRLKDAGLKSAQVSLEGPTAEVHDGLTQVPGSFERTLNGVNLLREAGLHVHTNTTVNRLNAPYLTGLVGFAKSLGMDRLSMNMVIPCGSAPNSEVTISYTEVAALVRSVKQTADEVGINFLWYSPTPYCMFNPVVAKLGGKSCAACDGLLSVSPTGDVLPCSSVPEGVGNLLAQRFADVWNSPKALYWREKRYAHAICLECDQFGPCAGACPIYWDAMGCEELKNAREAVAVR